MQVPLHLQGTGGVVDKIEFVPWPKTPRLFKESMIITEKIDGTNAAIGVVEITDRSDIPAGVDKAQAVYDGHGGCHLVYAQSRNRIITPATPDNKGADNYQFAEWVWSNAESLLRVLGEGLHFGEWWGAGIARNYGQTSRYFSLFNTSRWGWLDRPEARLVHGVPSELRAVPVLRINQLDTEAVREEMRELERTGSRAAPGYMHPEGVCVFLPAVGRTLKVTFDGDNHKSLGLVA